MAMLAVPTERLPAQAPSPTPASPFRLLKSVSGSRGEIKGGRYVVLDPRTSFRVPEDSTIVVYFEWLGPAGKHQLAGTWRGPANTSTTSAFEYVAKDSSFSAYWELTLPPTAPRGAWRLEATIDGYPAGAHTFEVGGPDAPAPAATPVRVPLTRQEVFARALGASVIVEALDTNGTRLAIGPGFPVDARRIATAFGRINNASRLRVRAGTGPAVETDQVIAWNRRQGWVLVGVEGLELQVPPTSAVEVRPGDPCFSVGTSPEGALAVASCEIVGASTIEPAGARLNLSFFSGGGTAGAALLNEFGEVVGMLSDNESADSSSLTQIRLRQLSDIPTATAVPVGTLSTAATPVPATLAALAARGFFVPPVTHQRQVLSGGFATAILARGASTQPLDQKVEFTRADKTITTFVTWNPAERFKGVTTMRLFDADNRSLGETKPAKLSLRPGDLLLSHWSMTPPPPGVYRADVMLDGHIAWRGYFRVND